MVKVETTETPGLDAMLHVPTGREALIERLKREVAYKARAAGVLFDEEDIQDRAVGMGYHLVALLYIKTPRLEEVDGELVETDNKTPNLWLEWPPPYVWDENMNTHRVNPRRLSCVTVPAVRVRCDWLCYLIGPDDRIVTGGRDVIATLNESTKRYAQATFRCPDGWVERLAYEGKAS